jgi:hypothetical protein
VAMAIDYLHIIRPILGVPAHGCKWLAWLRGVTGIEGRQYNGGGTFHARGPFCCFQDKGTRSPSQRRSLHSVRTCFTTLVAAFGALISGWKTPFGYRAVMGAWHAVQIRSGKPQNAGVLLAVADSRASSEEIELGWEAGVEHYRKPGGLWEGCQPATSLSGRRRAVPAWPF